MYDDDVNEMVDRLWEASGGETELDGRAVRRMAIAALQVETARDDARFGAFEAVLKEEIDEERDKILGLLIHMNAPAKWIDLVSKNTHRKESRAAMQEIKVA